MSMDENTLDGGVTENLDDFSTEFFGQSTVEPEPASSEVEEVGEDADTDALTEEDTHSEDDTLEPETDEDEEIEEEVEEPAPKPKQSRAQKRIEELVAKNHEMERKLNEILAKQNKEPEPTKPEPVKQVEKSTGPQPTDLNEDGTDKYPLGEFDATYIRDLTRHALHEEREAIKAEEAREAQQRAQQAEAETLHAEWVDKLGPAKERYPDFEEKGSALLATIGDLDPAYDQYLTATFKGMDHGPDVLYYLANNPAEAQRIIEMGPTKATIALGRLSARFESEDTPQVRQKVTKAPPPPATLNKGTSTSKAVTADTDDLDAFTAILYPKRRR